MAFQDLVRMIDDAVRVNAGGVSVVYDLGGSPITLVGMVEMSYRLETGGEGAGVSTGETAVWLDAEDLPGDPETDDPTVTIAGVDYYVVEAKRDDFGLSYLLILRARSEI